MFDRRFERFKLKKVMMMMRKELMLHMLMTVAITRKTDRQNKTDRERERVEAIDANTESDRDKSISLNKENRYK